MGGEAFSCGVLLLLPSVNSLAVSVVAMGRKKIHFENKCSYCGRMFKRRYNLVVHERVHNGEKPYACTLKGCAKQFAYKSSLDSHMVSHRRAAEMGGEIVTSPKRDSLRGIDKELRELEAVLTGAPRPDVGLTHIDPKIGRSNEGSSTAEAPEGSTTDQNRGTTWTGSSHSPNTTSFRDGERQERPQGGPLKICTQYPSYSGQHLHMDRNNYDTQSTPHSPGNSGSSQGQDLLVENSTDPHASFNESYRSQLMDYTENLWDIRAFGHTSLSDLDLDISPQFYF